MTELCDITFQPAGRKIRVEKGITLREAALRASIHIRGECGGHGRCGKCRVVVTSPRNPTPSGPLDSESRPGLADDAPPFRLACQTRVAGPLTVRGIAGLDENDTARGKTGIEGPFPVDPPVRRFFIDGVSSGDADTGFDEDVVGLIQSQVDPGRGGELRFNEPEVLQRLSLPAYCRDAPLTLVHHASRGVTSVLRGRMEQSLGLAVDIGTTTLAAYLCDLGTGDVVAAESIVNPQRRHGEDVITRISMANRQKDGLPILQGLVIEAVNRLIRSCRNTAGAAREDIDEVTVVGNTAMEQIFAGIHPHRLGVSPYLPFLRNIPDHMAATLGLDLSPAANIFFFPVESGFIGGDILAALLAEGAHHRGETCLIVDIGTNGEIALVTPDRIWATSCATGPAFEGGHLSCGMRAQAGAIYRVCGNPGSDGFRYRIAGREDGIKAAGICGSGVVDAVSAMLEAGLLLSNGRLDEKKKAVVRDGGGIGRKVVIAPPEKSQSGEGVYITLHDIRQVQLAKAAVAAGIRCLLQKAGVNRVNKTVLTGAFGARFDWRNAVRLGLFPARISDSRVVSSDNLAGVGAIMALLDKKARRDIEHIRGRMACIELAREGRFADEFAAATLFPAWTPESRWMNKNADS